MIIFCRHGSDPETPRPCPDRCPSQAWPTWLFDGEQIRPVYRDYLDAVKQYDQEWRAYADQFPDGRYHGEGTPFPPPRPPSRPVRAP